MIICCLFTYQILANLPDNVKQLLDWEINHNLMLSSQNPYYQNERLKKGQFSLKYFLVPKNLVRIYLDRSTPEYIRDFFLVNKDGKEYIRLPINIEDTTYFKRIQNFLTKFHYGTIFDNNHIAYLTSSRSILTQNNGKYFFFKVSTNETGGIWTNKKVKYSKVKKSQIGHKTVTCIERNLENQIKDLNVRLLKEPLSFTIKGLNIGLIAREINILNEDESIYLKPMFAHFYDKTDNIKEKVLGPFALAMAQFVYYFGQYYKSAHGQNFYQEYRKNKITQDLETTGKFYFKDYNEAFLSFAPYGLVLGKSKYLEARFGMLKGYTLNHDEFYTVNRANDIANYFLNKFKDEFIGLNGSESKFQIKRKGSPFSYLVDKYYLNGQMKKKWSQLDVWSK